MRIHWWQSIRWRLALGSMVVVLLATGLLAIAAIAGISYSYSHQQMQSLSDLAKDSALDIGKDYEPLSGKGQLSRAVDSIFPMRVDKALANTGVIRDRGEYYQFYVLDPLNHPVYPKVWDPKGSALLFWTPISKALRTACVGSNVNSVAIKLCQAIIQVKKSMAPGGGEINHGLFNLFPQPFVVLPIRSDVHSVGVLVMLPVVVITNDKALPDFIDSAGSVVLRAAILIALLAALAAILFARTITRPLAKVTSATRVLASGDYGARVLTGAAGELGELAHNFNDMAAQLQRDVEELRKQELWRRELIMGVTHDLATPLTAIAGLGEALVDGVNQSREDYEATGRIIVRETLRLRRLVKDLHMMAKVEADALHPQRKPVRLATLIDDVLAVLATEFERVHVEPRNIVSYNLSTIEADSDMLARVFSNLCDNALHYTPPGGIVTIEAAQQGTMLAIAVTDTGVGIPPEALERVFERFFRADSARQSTIGGSGLGLAIVRAIIEAHGGRIWAENVSGAGARFIFTLPLSQTQPVLADEPTLRLPRKGLHKSHVANNLKKS